MLDRAERHNRRRGAPLDQAGERHRGERLELSHENPSRRILHQRIPARLRTAIGPRTNAVASASPSQRNTPEGLDARDGQDPLSLSNASPRLDGDGLASRGNRASVSPAASRFSANDRVEAELSGARSWLPLRRHTSSQRLNRERARRPASMLTFVRIGGRRAGAAVGSVSLLLRTTSTCVWDRPCHTSARRLRSSSR